MGRVVARGDDQAARPLVEPVHDARPLLPAGGRPGAPKAEQGVDQGAAVVARRRMHDHPGRLVDHDDVLVLIHDVEVDGLGGRGAGTRGRHLELDHVAGRHVVGGARRHPVDHDPALLDQAEGRRAADAFRMLGEKTVEPRRGHVGRQAVRGFRIRYPSANSTTPTLTAESATLKTGNQWSAMKSVTVPYMMRSKPLPIVPPRIRPSSASTTKSLRWVAT